VFTNLTNERRVHAVFATLTNERRGHAVFANLTNERLGHAVFANLTNERRVHAVFAASEENEDETDVGCAISCSAKGIAQSSLSVTSVFEVDD